MPSQSLAVPPAASADAHAFFARKLAFETDCADVWSDMSSGNPGFVLADVRSESDYRRSHALGAISLPQKDITPERMAEFTQDTCFVVYCWGPGCNGATKAAAKLSALGYPVKEMIGGIEYWENKERYPVERFS